MTYAVATGTHQRHHHRIQFGHWRLHLHPGRQLQRSDIRSTSPSPTECHQQRRPPSPSPSHQSTTHPSPPGSFSTDRRHRGHQDAARHRCRQRIADLRHLHPARARHHHQLQRRHRCLHLQPGDQLQRHRPFSLHRLRRCSHQHTGHHHHHRHRGQRRTRREWRKRSRTNEDTALNTTLPAGTDVDGQTLTYAIATPPTHGTITNFNTATGAYTYTPATNYNGPDSFNYTVSDGVATSTPATVTITVTAVNDARSPPTAPSAPPRTPPTTSTLPATDVDSATLTYADRHQTHQRHHHRIQLRHRRLHLHPQRQRQRRRHLHLHRLRRRRHQQRRPPSAITITAVNDAPSASDGSFSTNEDTATNKHACPAPMSTATR